MINKGPQRGILVYYAFGLLFLEGQDLRQLPLAQRKARLKTLVKRIRRVVYLDHVKEHGLGLFAGALALGLEGIVAKDSKSPYVEGPRATGHWLKIKSKDYQRQEKIEFLNKR